MSDNEETAEDVGAPSYDAVIVGAGTAGLSAALVLGRSRRRVLILDGGAPRNAPAGGAHGFFTRDGVGPRELLEIRREQLTPYESVHYREATATEVSGSDGSFEVFLDDGATATTRKLLLATGVEDELPETPGFRELWGRGVYHCPYCHGWEVRDRALAVYAAADDVGSFARAVLLRNWSRGLAVVTDGPAALDAAGRAKLDVLGVALNEKPIARVEGRTDGSQGLSRIVFSDGSSLVRDALFYTPPQRQCSGLPEALGCAVAAMGHAPAIVEADPMTSETSVAGVYVAGDAGTPLQSLSQAAASGARAAAFLNHALCEEDTEVALTSAGQAAIRWLTCASITSCATPTPPR